MEAIGLLASAIAELRRVLEVIAGPDDLDFSMPLEAAPDLAPRAIDPCCTTIGVLPEALEGLSRGQAEAFRARLSVLEEAGFALRELPFPEFARFALVHRIVGSVEASSCAGRYDGVRYGRRASGARNWNEMYLRSRAAAFGPLVKRYLFQGAFFQFERYSAFEDACRIRARLKAAMDRLAAQVDVLALPADSGTVAGDGLSLAGTYAELAPLLFANVTGQPALVLPPASGSAGGGLQLTAARRGDGRLLDLGQYLMALDGKGER
jgi:aspartyl-tRNA(Asn)/glutamyl-tRNA(Gln) amidotransferase subunit A